MAGKSAIEWCDRTWNPVRGCSMAKGSETGGCLNCYAARMASRNLPDLKSPTTGKPFARILDSGPRWTGDVELIESALDAPLHWKKPQRIFVNSMSDLFHENLPDEAIDRVFAVIALCPQHTFQVLTKRPERMREYFAPGEVCALGALGKSRGMDLQSIDPEDPASVAIAFNIAPQLASEIVWMNDENFDRRWDDVARNFVDVTPEERWIGMRAWVASKLVAAKVQA